MIILDASAAAALLLRQPASEAIVRAIAEEEIAAPELMAVELLSVLRGWVCSGQLSEPRAREALEDLELLGLRWHAERPLLRMAWSFRDNASAYDAVYLALAEVLGERSRSASVLTLDARLARAFPERTLHPV